MKIQLKKVWQTIAQEAYAILEKAQISYNLKSDLYEIIKEQQKGAIATLASMELEPAMFGALCEILTAENKREINCSRNIISKTGK